MRSYQQTVMFDDSKLLTLLRSHPLFAAAGTGHADRVRELVSARCPVDFVEQVHIPAMRPHFCFRWPGSRSHCSHEICCLPLCSALCSVFFFRPFSWSSRGRQNCRNSNNNLASDLQICQTVLSFPAKMRLAICDSEISSVTPSERRVQSWLHEKKIVASCFFSFFSSTLNPCKWFESISLAKIVNRSMERRLCMWLPGTVVTRSFAFW